MGKTTIIPLEGTQMTSTRQHPCSIAVYGLLAAGNIGNDASFEAALTWIQEYHPEVAIQGITFCPDRFTERYGLPAQHMLVDAHVGPRPVSKAIGRILDLPRSLKLVSGVDAVVVPGMGVLEDSLPLNPWGFPLLLFSLASACKVRRTRFVLLDIGAQPITNPISRFLFRSTVRLAAHVSYRDSLSALAMHPSKSRRPPMVVPDLAFATPRVRDTPRPSHVVIGVMSFAGRTATPTPEHPAAPPYLDGLQRIARILLQEGCEITLVGGDHGDYAVAEHLFQQIRRQLPVMDTARLKIAYVETFTELLSVMASAEIVIASRYHNLVAALIQRRPTLAISYAPKCQVLMGVAGMEQFTNDFTSFSPDLVISQVKHLMKNELAVSKAIDEKLFGHARGVLGFLDQTFTSLNCAPSPRHRSRQFHGFARMTQTLRLPVRET